MTKVRGSGQEYQTATAHERLRGATPHPRSPGAAERRYPVSEVRGGCQEELPHGPMPKARGSGREEQPTSEARGSDERSYPASKVRGGGREELPHAPKPEDRGDGREELPHAPTPEARGSGREEQLTPEDRGGDKKSYPEPCLCGRRRA